MTIACGIFNTIHDKAKWEDEFTDILDECKVPWEDLDYDSYDHSVELYKMPNDYRMDEATQKAICGAGFWIAFVNHLDGSETHYYWPHGVFVVHAGYRKEAAKGQSK